MCEGALQEHKWTHFIVKEELITVILNRAYFSKLESKFLNFRWPQTIATWAGNITRHCLCSKTMEPVRFLEDVYEIYGMVVVLYSISVEILLEL